MCVRRRRRGTHQPQGVAAAGPSREGPSVGRRCRRPVRTPSGSHDGDVRARCQDACESPGWTHPAAGRPRSARTAAMSGRMWPSEHPKRLCVFRGEVTLGEGKPGAEAAEGRTAGLRRYGCRGWLSGAGHRVSIVPKERRNELFARLEVAQALHCDVERLEDGSQDWQVDAEILHPDGAAGLEIVADVDPEQSSMWRALDGLGHEVQIDGLGSSMDRVAEKVR